MSKLVLYTIPQSVWASAARLVIYELGYEDSVEFMDINLAKGENFLPEFLAKASPQGGYPREFFFSSMGLKNLTTAKNPNGILPTLQTPEGTLTNTTDVIKYLVVHVRTGTAMKSSNATLIESLHSDALDPNFAKQMARTDEELASKADKFLLAFLEGRQRALEAQSARPEGAPYKDFYDAKKASNGEFLAIVDGSAPVEAKQAFFDKANALQETIRSFIYDELPKMLPALDSDNGHFLSGDLPGETDFHLAAWLARIFSTCGAGQVGNASESARDASQKARDASEKAKAAFGVPLPPTVLAYWNAWVARPSWGKVYGQGLH
ncbi:hypothetical protein EV714DRAFT_271101 [Schizophyllum commune]